MEISLAKGKLSSPPQRSVGHPDGDKIGFEYFLLILQIESGVL